MTSIQTPFVFFVRGVVERPTEARAILLDGGYCTTFCGDRIAPPFPSTTTLITSGEPPLAAGSLLLSLDASLGAPASL